MALLDLLRRHWLPAAALLALAPVPACGGDGTDSGSDDITDVKNSTVKKQSIGNCWVYASVGWAESLRLGHAGEQLDLSESYLSYWHWFEQIHGGGGSESQLATLEKGEIGTGGWFGVAAELMRRYGVIGEGAFIPEEAEAARSSRQSGALAAINTSLKSGALAKPEARRDGALVRAELDKAWQLTAGVSTLLDDVFGKDVSRTLTDEVAIPAESGLRRAGEIEVGKAVSGGTEKALTLADAIGTPASTWDVKKRSGEFAWNEVSYPSSATSRRDFLKRAQKALHSRQPVIMTWFVDFAAMSNGEFRAPPEKPGRQGGHMTVLEDYQVSNVPGFGTLAAGELVTDPAALEAALATEATIDFFRIKNSWGSDLAPPNAGEDLKGYHDLYMKYLDGPIAQCVAVGADACGRTTSTAGLWGMVLPPAAFITGGGGSTGCHDPCETGGASKASCGSCEASVCAADPFCCDADKGSWDSTCVQQVESVCGATCG